MYFMIFPRSTLLHGCFLPSVVAQIPYLSLSFPLLIITSLRLRLFKRESFSRRWDSLLLIPFGQVCQTHTTICVEHAMGASRLSRPRLTSVSAKTWPFSLQYNLPIPWIPKCASSPLFRITSGLS